MSYQVCNVLKIRKGLNNHKRRVRASLFHSHGHVTESNHHIQRKQNHDPQFKTRKLWSDLEEGEDDNEENDRKEENKHKEVERDHYINIGTDNQTLEN